jgi:hypothetical protein
LLIWRHPELAQDPARSGPKSWWTPYIAREPFLPAQNTLTTSTIAAEHMLGSLKGVIILGLVSQAEGYKNL